MPKSNGKIVVDGFGNDEDARIKALLELPKKSAPKKPNAVSDWLDRACSEFKTPEEMKDAVMKLPEDSPSRINAKKLLLNRASRWGARQLMKKTDKHWSKK